MRCFWIVGLVCLAGCAGLNPNPGERTTDTAWEMGKYPQALDTARRAAERGEPWAQLRLGIYYNSGYGVEVDMQEAVKWYTRAARQYADGKWAEGYIVGATGEAGYFGQKNDAIIAMYRLADLYYQGEGVEQDLERSYLLISSAINKMNEDLQVFFCCEWSGGRWFRLSQFTELKAALENKMSADQLAKTRARLVSWSPSEDL